MPTKCHFLCAAGIVKAGGGSKTLVPKSELMTAAQDESGFWFTGTARQSEALPKAHDDQASAGGIDSEFKRRDARCFNTRLRFTLRRRSNLRKACSRTGIRASAVRSLLKTSSASI